ncbi:MAG: hypothetical protein JKY12_07150 [Sneathiella sp.]|nr:hypothetical protein [Sneathiella sp.]
MHFLTEVDYCNSVHLEVSVPILGYLLERQDGVDGIVKKLDLKNDYDN